MSAPVPEALTLNRLIIRNLGRLELVNVKLEGESLVVVGGDNEAGKSTLLRAIVAALASKAPLPGRLRSRDAKMPIEDLLRRGELGGDITLEFTGGVTVSRTWTKKVGSGVTKSTLKVEGIDTTGGKKTALDRLWSEIAIDLSSFDQMEPREQGRLAQEALGIDWTELDARDKIRRQERTAVNRAIGKLEALLANLEPHGDAPAEEVSTAELLAELKRRQEHNAGLDTLIQRRREAEGLVARYQERIDENEKEAKRLELRVASLRKEQQGYRGIQAKEQETALAVQKQIDAFDEQLVDDIEEQLRTADETNHRVRARKKHERVTAELAAEQKAAAEHDAAIKEIAREKEQQLAAANFPVPGLSFADDGQMLLDNEPARQASGGRRLLAWAALALFLLKRKAAAAGLPFIGLLLVDEARWDARYLAKADKLAKEHGGQILLTKVGKEDATIVIEDGRIREG